MKLAQTQSSRPGWAGLPTSVLGRHVLNAFMSAMLALPYCYAAVRLLAACKRLTAAAEHMHALADKYPAANKLEVLCHSDWDWGYNDKTFHRICQVRKACAVSTIRPYHSANFVCCPRLVLRTVTSSSSS